MKRVQPRNGMGYAYQIKSSLSVISALSAASCAAQVFVGSGFGIICHPFYWGELAMAADKRRSPVRVKLRRVNANLSKGYPPDGEEKIWWAHLKRALGTASSDFVNASLLELQVAAQLPFGGISEVGMNAALALIEGVAPRNEIEGAIAVQMACTHAAAMSVLARFRGGGGTEHRVAALASAAARLLKAYSIQVETLRRLRHGGDQRVRVEHVHVNEGGQAVIGNVGTTSAADAE
jgi:hypothetical protein